MPAVERGRRGRRRGPEDVTSPDRVWAVRVLCLFLVGGGLALVAWFYALSAPPERASAQPQAPAQDLSGDIDVGSLNGGVGESGPKPAQVSKDRPTREPSPETGRAGVVGSADEVDAGPSQDPVGGGLADPVDSPRASSPEPDPGYDVAPAEASMSAQASASADAARNRPEPPPVTPAQAPTRTPGNPPEDTPAAEDTPAPVPEDKTLYLTIPKMERVRGAEVRDAAGDDQAALDAGVIHLSGTGFPWEDEANVYLAGHRMGWAGTGSYLVFYDLDVLVEGDEIFVEDANGRRYSYRVTGSDVVAPDELEVAHPAPGKNILTLQTCTLPDYTDRLIVRAERVA